MIALDFVAVIFHYFVNNFNYIPKELSLNENADFVHFTTNNTIFGTQFHEAPQIGPNPLVADMSSDILSRPIQMDKYGLIYAGAQKNMGPSGVTLVVIRKDLLERSQSELQPSKYIPTDELPTMLNYNTHAEKKFFIQHATHLGH